MQISTKMGRVEALIASAIDRACDRIEGVGGRNNAVNRAGFTLGGLQHLGLSESEAEREVRGAALSAGLSQREALAAFRSGWRAGTAKPLPIETGSEPVRFKRRLNINRRRYLDNYKPDGARLSMKPESRAALKDVAEVMRQAWQVQTPRLGEWLRQRGIPRAEGPLRAQGAVEQTDAIRALAELSDETLRLAALRSGDRTWWPIRWIFDGSPPPQGVFIPVYSVWSAFKLAEPVSWRFRVYEPEEFDPNWAPPKSISSFAAPWGPWPLGAKKRPGPQALNVVCEGEPDWLTALALLRNREDIAVLGVPGSGWQGQWTGALEHGRTVILEQGDEPARKLTEQILRSLAERQGASWVGENVRRVSAPEHEDWNDLARSNPRYCAEQIMGAIDGR